MTTCNCLLRRETCNCEYADANEKLVQMMIRCGLATGHGDTIDDLIFELEKQIRNTLNAFSDARKQIERSREALETVALKEKE